MNHELKRETFRELIENKSKNKLIKILLPDSYIDNYEYNWINQRESELKRFSKAYTKKGKLSEEINDNYTYLLPYANENHIQLRRYNFPHLGRIIVTDRYAYYNPIDSNHHGNQCKIYKFGNRGQIYGSFLRYFDMLWEAANEKNNKKA